VEKEKTTSPGLVVFVYKDILRSLFAKYNGDMVLILLFT